MCVVLLCCVASTRLCCVCVTAETSRRPWAAAKSCSRALICCYTHQQPLNTQHCGCRLLSAHCCAAACAPHTTCLSESKNDPEEKNTFYHHSCYCFSVRKSHVKVQKRQQVKLHLHDDSLNCDKTERNHSCYILPNNDPPLFNNYSFTQCKGHSCSGENMTTGPAAPAALSLLEIWVSFMVCLLTVNSYLWMPLVAALQRFFFSQN